MGTVIAVRGEQRAEVDDVESFDPARDFVNFYSSPDAEPIRRRWQSLLKLGYWRPPE